MIRMRTVGSVILLLNVPLVRCDSDPVQLDAGRPVQGFAPLEVALSTDKEYGFSPYATRLVVGCASGDSSPAIQLT